MVLSIIWNRTWKEDEQIKETKEFSMIVHGFDHQKKEKNFFATLKQICKMTKVYIVYKEEWDGTDRMLSVHATEEGAKKECQRLFERRRKTYNPYHWEEVEIEP
jgi:hypothetical protein